MCSHCGIAGNYVNRKKEKFDVIKNENKSKTVYLFEFGDPLRKAIEQRWRKTVIFLIHSRSYLENTKKKNSEKHNQKCYHSYTK